MSKYTLTRSAFMEGLLAAGCYRDHTEAEMETEWLESDTYALTKEQDEVESQMEAEHLRDMLHCQERAANLLKALRTILGIFPEALRGTTPIIAATATAKAAIAREEKEGNQ